MGKTPYIRLYKTNSIPLKEVDNAETRQGDIIYSSTGKCFECVGKDEAGAAVFEQVHESELVDGEVLENIEEDHDLLSLFWKLSYRRLNKIKDETKA